MKNIFKLDIAPNRVYGLDILRALAIWFVLYAHNLSYLNQLIPVKVTRWFMFDGVTIFFVLSGFLIGTILIRILENNEADAKTLLTFWKRRWYRTLPNYFFILTIITIFYSTFRGLDTSKIWEYYLFIQNLNSIHPTFFKEAWSLSVEEWFYLIMPLITFVLLRFTKMKPLIAISVCALAIIIFSTEMRWYKWNLLESTTMVQWRDHVRTQVFTRLDSLMYGVLAACLAFYNRSFWTKYKKPMFLLGLFLLLFYAFYFNRNGVRNPNFAVFNLSIISIGTALILPALSLYKDGKGLLFKVITYVSLTSYSAYLINLAIVKNIMLVNIVKIFPQMPPSILAAILMLLFFGLTFAGSILLYKYFELPMMKLRDKK